MGFKNFNAGFRKYFGGSIETSVDVVCDVLIVELNGIFYKSCERIFGNCCLTSNHDTQFELILFKEVCNHIDNLIMNYLPKKRVFLVVDGVCSMLKCTEQRQRRYKNCLENKYNGLFDLNNFSPGTKVMHHLTKYIDWYLRKIISERHSLRNIKFFFSNEKVPGEGEIKVIDFIRTQCFEDEVINIVSGDSDLILLSLQIPNEIRMIRNSIHSDIEVIRIDNLKKILKEKVAFSTIKSDIQFFRDIYILFLFMGNDYIRNSPCVFHFKTVYDDIFKLYRDTELHFTDLEGGFDRKSFCVFCGKLSEFERQWLNQKYKNHQAYFPDQIMLQQTSEGKFCFEKYKVKYSDDGDGVDFYLKTIETILAMFSGKEFDWFFYFPKRRSPFLSSFHNDWKTVETGRNGDIEKRFYRNSFFQMLTIIPPPSYHLLPKCFHDIFTECNSFYPSVITFDMTDKTKLWEANLNLPNIDIENYQNYYSKKKDLFTKEEKIRNRKGKIIQYVFSQYCWDDFNSYYGTIQNMKVLTKLI